MFEWLITMYMCSESLSKLACVLFGDSHARCSPLLTHVSRRYIFRSPHLLSFSISPFSLRPCYIRPAPRFNLNFAPAKPKAALRFFKVTREAISRGDLAHLLERLRARYPPYSSHFRNNGFPFVNTLESHCDGRFSQ